MLPKVHCPKEGVSPSTALWGLCTEPTDGGCEFHRRLGGFVLLYFYEGAELLCQGLRESKMILAILGRAKVANKIQLINKCWTESVKIVIVGGLACTFFK